MLNVDALKTKSFTKVSVVFQKGDPAEFAYLIRSGIVMIVGERDGQEIILDTLYRGDFFGEMALVDDEARSATAIVGEDTICTVFSKDELDDSLTNSDLLAAALVRLLTRRIRESTLREEDD